MKNGHYPSGSSRLSGGEIAIPTAVPDCLAGTAQPGWFGTTHWSVLFEAGGQDSDRRMAALEKLCQSYWRPVYAFIRHNGHEVHDAQDLTQAFFAHLLERNALRKVDPRKGKFRSFLLVTLRHFLANEAKRANAAKRGGGNIPVSLEAATGEDLFLAGVSGDPPPEKLFDRSWALAVMASAFAGLRAEFEKTGQIARFEELKIFLCQQGGGEDYAKAAASLALTPAAVKVAVHRLRHRYGELMRLEIAHTVESPFEIEAEMRYLLDLIMQ